ncbi:hypothetical protein [Parafrankia elaeagni]|nr:hypothetical protein [Parafrankia elaeagni]
MASVLLPGRVAVDHGVSRAAEGRLAAGGGQASLGSAETSGDRWPECVM